MASQEIDDLRRKIITAANAIATADERNIKDVDGRFLPAHEWPVREAMAVQQISMKRQVDGEPKICSVRFASKAAARRLLERLESGRNE